MSTNQRDTERGRGRGGDGESSAIPVEWVPGPALLYRTAENCIVVEQANCTFEETFALPSLAGKPILTHVHAEDRASVAADLRAVAEESSETATAECRLRTGEGDWERVRMDVTGHGESERIVATVRPAETEAGGVPARDSDSEGVAAVAHEIRNQLEVAMARLEFLEDDYENDHLGAIAGALDRIDRVVTAELDLVRGGGSETDRTPLALCDVVAESWDGVAAEGATLLCRCEAIVRADRPRLQSLFENLFRNAVEHGTSAEGSLGVVDGNGDAAGTDLQVVVGDLPDGSGFYVADDGPGIPADVREEIFSFGYSTQSGGTGIGLALVQEIVREHGWEIGVTDSEAGGARFEVTGVDFRDR